MSNQSPLTPKPSRILFIDEAYLKSTTPIFDNVDPKMLISAIQVSQDKHMNQILGSGVYSELKDQIANNTLTTLNTKILEEYCQPVVAWFAVVEAIPNISMHIMNKSVEIKKSENSDAATKEDLIFLMQNYEATAMFYAKQLITYIRRNNVDYPLYFNPGGSYGSNIDTIYGVGTEYFSGLVIPNNTLIDAIACLGFPIGIPLPYLGGR